ncbi:MAG: SAM-dependent methyltransferase [Pseudomonadota bacterium]
MTALKDKLRRQITSTGPISLAAYMNLCLTDPEHGYYTTRDPLGQDGDFTTAPEISQMFGELIGLCLAQTWIDRGAPTPFVLAELGPGRGTLMGDLLRATQNIPGFHDAMTLHLVDTSPALRAIQKNTIPKALQHHSSITELPDGPLFLVANEFFDSLPIRQFQRVEDRWRERVVGLKGDALALGLTDPMSQEHLAHRLLDTRDGDIVEVSASGQNIAKTLGARIASQGGVALIVDYGGWRSLGDTFQAVRGHEVTDPLDAPGAADLTAHVDFEALAEAAKPAAASQMVTQGVFLERLGITARAELLAKGLRDDALRSHIAAHRRLTHPEEMGTLFKVMALYEPGTPCPPGVEPA